MTQQNDMSESYEDVEETEEVEETLEEATRESESIEDSIIASIEEVKEETHEAKTNENLQGDKREEEKEPIAKEISEAAKTLAKSKRKGKKTLEAAELDLDPAKKKDEVATRYEPPARFPVEKKEWFNKQPREVQEEVVKGWGEIESHTTKLWQDINRYKTRYEQLDRVMGHYLPNWNLKGITDVQAITEMCAAQDLIQKDPLRAYDHMLRTSGVTPEMINEYRQSGGQSRGYQAQTPAQNSSLTRDDIFGILNEWNQQTSAQTAQQQAVSEIEQVRRETEPTGTYKYPELWDANHLQRVQPLVEDLRRTQPGLSWAEATKRAVNTLRVLDGKIGSLSPTGQRLPQEQEDIQRARAASVSVRGRGNAAIPTMNRAKPGESIEDSIRAEMAAWYDKAH